MTDTRKEPDRRILLSVVIPCFNEADTLLECVQRLLRIQNQHLHLEIIIVDDCSSDDSARIAEALSREFKEIKTLHHTTNRGKGAALRTGFQSARGDIVAIQDADLEYDPQDLLRLVGPIIEGRADAVSPVLGKGLIARLKDRGLGVFLDGVNLHQSCITGSHVSYNRLVGGILSRIGLHRFE